MGVLLGALPLLLPEPGRPHAAVPCGPAPMPAGLRGACFWVTDKRRMPLDAAKPEINVRYSQGTRLCVPVCLLIYPAPFFSACLR